MIKLVIKIPEGLKDVFENRTVTALDVEEMRMAIKNGTPLPIGKWIKYNVDIAPHPLHCSECGWSDHHLNRTIVSDFKYCPNCGTRMEVEADADSD